MGKIERGAARGRVNNSMVPKVREPSMPVLRLEPNEASRDETTGNGDELIFNNKALFEIFKAGPLKDWAYEEIVGDKLMTIRRSLPNDGAAHGVSASNAEGFPLQIPMRQFNFLYQEAVAYAMEFASAEDGDMRFSHWLF